MKNNKRSNLTVTEPAIQYTTSLATREFTPTGINTDAKYELNKDDYMTVTEYFDKVRKALNLRYENTQSNNQ